VPGLLQTVEIVLTMQIAVANDDQTAVNMEASVKADLKDPRDLEVQEAEVVQKVGFGVNLHLWLASCARNLMEQVLQRPVSFDRWWPWPPLPMTMKLQMSAVVVLLLWRQKVVHFW